MRLHPRQIALITGGGTGIGRGIALALARRGLHLALVGRRAAPLQEVAAEAMALGSQVLVLPADLTVAAARHTVYACTQDALGPVHLLVNNAGLLAGGALATQHPNAVEQVVATNLTAALELTRFALPDLAATQGAVVLVGSTMSYVPMPYASLYAATKAGLAAFGEALRYEVAPWGVQVLVVAPPATKTAMLQERAARAGFRGLPLADPAAVGARIVQALEAGQQEAVWGAGERLLVRLHRLAPGLVRWGLGKAAGRFAGMMGDTKNT